MATYCIGDVHGCYNEFMALLEEIKFDEAKDELLLTGDLIGRGPFPVETMKAVMSMKNTVSVLGNHDLNFLAVAEGIVTPRPKDNLQVILDSPLCDDIVKYFINSPLLFIHKTKLLCVAHAGIYPLWELTFAKKAAKETCKVIRDDLRRKILLANMYCDEPNIYNENLSGLKLWRFTLNAFTRMRLMYRTGALDFKNNAISPELVKNDGLYPWFDLGNPMQRKKKQYTLVFGHWAALGAKCQRPFVKALDTGCVWGDRLSCWCFDTDKTYRIKSLGYTEPKVQVSKV